MFHSVWTLEKEETFMGYGVCWIISKIIFIPDNVLSCSLATPALSSWRQCSWTFTVSVENSHHLKISFPFLECSLSFLARVSPIFIRSWCVKNSVFSDSCLILKARDLVLSSWKWIRKYSALDLSADIKCRTRKKSVYSFHTWFSI